MSRCASEKNFLRRFALTCALAAGCCSAPAAPNYFTRTWQVEQGLPQNKVTAVVQTRDGYLWVGTYNGLARFDGVRFTVFDDNNTPALRSSRITSLFEAADGALWIGTESGDVSQYLDGRFTAVPRRANWSAGKIYAITADDAGDVWLFNEAGELARVRDGRVLSPPSGAVSKVLFQSRGQDGTIWVAREGLVSCLKGGELRAALSTNDYVQGFCASRDGGFWVACNGLIRKWKDGQWVADLGAAPWGGSIVPNLMETSSGALAGGTPGDGLWLVIPDQTNQPALHFSHTNGLPSNWVISLWQDRENDLWCGTGAGLAVVRPNNLETISPPDKWKNCPVLSVLPAPDGALWVGTEGAGVYRLQDGAWTNFGTAQGLRNSYVWSLAADGAGHLWAGTWGGGLFTRQDDAFNLAAGLENYLPPMPALLFASDDKIDPLLATKSSVVGPQSPVLGPQTAAASPDSGLPTVDSGLRDGGEGDSILWIGTTAGAARYQDGKLERFSDLAGGPFGDVRAIARDASGALWFGTAGNGLIRFDPLLATKSSVVGPQSPVLGPQTAAASPDSGLRTGDSGLSNGQFHRFRKSDGLSSDFIECLHFAGDGALWIGTFGGGLDRFKNGKFAAVGRAQGLPNGVIGHIEADGRGYFWMSSYAGILRASEKDLNRCADGEIAQVPFVTYGINDGMPTLECAEGLQSAGCRTADGRLWFPTAKGLVAVDPAAVSINPLAPPVKIEALRVDDQEVRGGGFGVWNAESAAADGRSRSAVRGPHLKIPPGRHRIEFEFTALSFVAPEKVRFKYRLNNFETEWAPAGTKRVATYNYIPPGDYSFQVIACNNDGVWNDTGASLAFVVLPHFWQTTWFHVLGGLATALAAGGAVWFDTRRRMRRRLERAERQRDIERERSRIARDIHDDLGAQLTRITMMSESARGDLHSPVRAAAGLGKIYDTARELTRSMDEIVWAISPRHDTLEGLATYLERFAQDWLVGAGIRCRLDLPLQFPEWHLTSEVRHNVFLGFKEALHNAVKHSGASEVMIRLTLKAGSFELAVEDNGRGFAAGGMAKTVSATPGRAASGNGLENMRRRLAAIGGNCEIQSALGAGTKVIFSVRLEASALGSQGR